MLCAADQLWLLRHAKGRLPSIETQHIKSKLHKRIHKFWSMNTLFRPFGPVINNYGPIENIDIENSFLNNPLLTFENLLFQNETHKDMHMVFVLDASLSLRTEDLWHLLLIVYGLQSLASSIELIAFSTEAKHIYRGRPFLLAKDLLQVYSQAIEPGYTNVEAGIRFGKEALQRYSPSQSQLIFITDGGWNMGCEPSKLNHLMNRWIFILLGETSGIEQQFKKIPTQSAVTFQLSSTDEVIKTCQKLKRSIQNVKCR